ncbi:MAG: DOMON-like domain-containing protein [Xenococcaceae cyanobacterium MO_167.B27]|nr:DOMON-like domain-containing protein [Xenococcaceae cyanobacterium MO_167.B27]
MSDRDFQLKPLTSSEFVPDINIVGKVSRQNNNLIMSYLLQGDLSIIAIPSLVINPERLDELWQETCFEFFLKIINTSNYWEFNLAPSGNWNVYHFDDYRQGMKKETAFKNLPFSIEHNNNSLKLHLALNLEPIINTEQDLVIGISSVIKTQSGNISYWSLIHPQPEADFHSQENFLIKLEG